MNDADTIVRDLLAGRDWGDNWTRLIDLYEGRVRAYFKRRLPSGTDIDDLVQETFIGLNLRNYDPRRTFQSYLFRIAHNKLMDLFRRQGRDRLVPEGSGDVGLLDGRPALQRTPSSNVRGKERGRLEVEALRRHLSEAIRDLKDSEKFERLAVLELLWVKGMRNLEAAQALGLTEMQIANHRFAGVKDLQKRLGAGGLSADVFPELRVQE